MCRSEQRRHPVEGLRLHPGAAAEQPAAAGRLQGGGAGGDGQRAAQATGDPGTGSIRGQKVTGSKSSPASFTTESTSLHTSCSSLSEAKSDQTFLVPVHIQKNYFHLRI